MLIVDCIFYLSAIIACLSSESGLQALWRDSSSSACDFPARPLHRQNICFYHLLSRLCTSPTSTPGNSHLQTPVGVLEPLHSNPIPHPAEHAFLSNACGAVVGLLGISYYHVLSLLPSEAMCSHAFHPSIIASTCTFSISALVKQNVCFYHLLSNCDFQRHFHEIGDGIHEHISRSHGTHLLAHRISCGDGVA